jgi:hypothetical protein
MKTVRTAWIRTGTNLTGFRLPIAMRLRGASNDIFTLYGANSVHIGFQQRGVQRGYFSSNVILKLSNIEQRSRNRNGTMVSSQLDINGEQQECSNSEEDHRAFARYNSSTDRRLGELRARV